MDFAVEENVRRQAKYTILEGKDPLLTPWGGNLLGIFFASVFVGP